MNLEALFTLFTGLPRQGPGSDAWTLEALRRLPPLRKDALALDIGCGTGRPTLVLARTLRTHVVGIDIHQPYLDELERAAAQAGLSEFVETRCLSMDALDYAPGSVDLIWSEGAIFVLGVAQALRQWKPLLRAGACLAFTDITWLCAEPPEEAVAFFQEVYPAIAPVEENRRRAESAGYEVLDAFPLPAQVWYTEYYTPLRERIARLRPELAGNPELAAVVASTEREMDVFDRYSTVYGYVFYLLRKPLSADSA